MIRFILALTLLGTCSAANAAVERCESCTPEEMFAAGELAVTQVSWNQPQYPVYVVNFTDGNVVKVAYQNNVDEDFDWERDEFDAWGISVEVEPSVRQYIQEMHAIMPPPVALSRSGANGSGSVAARANDPTMPGSVIDAISAPAYDISIHNKLNASVSASYRQAFYNAVSQFNPIPFFNPGDVPPPVRGVFDDGTYAYYTWDPATAQWVRIKGSARDAWGNPIPETRQAVANGGYTEYLFPDGAGEGMTSFVHHLNNMGVQIRQGGGSGSTTRIACTSAGDTVICEIVMI
ncbi:hypothetical protein CXF96_13940 [Stenotrophomonas sp. Betaine-02u-21]|uniref:hypothetical protein n=1 Tax=unclassified Stenotrophomonas TaxID=196198 RepID=UPI000C342FF8|nr:MULTISPECIES: hypothetical protein [unclassified Stenotrophomonas]PKH72808.1 hypothetical protein CXF96_13940 [Stenotrophomonas sp. Betaine-02u-21]PKH76226.1 hypothetical protein CXF90_02360 [Stenotrophomonas sp. Betaine-02u-23]PKH94273.1 hypothetical protein CXG43_18455 [Stenotrophomonas sp. Bg11-02]